MKENWKHIAQSGPCPEMDELIQYYDSSLTPEKQFTIENHLADCEICNDVLDGLSLMKDKKGLIEAEKELKERVDQLLFPGNQKRILMPVYRRLMIAASILLFAGLGVYLYTITKTATHSQAGLALADTIKTNPPISKETIITENIQPSAIASGPKKVIQSRHARAAEKIFDTVVANAEPLNDVATTEVQMQSAEYAPTLYADSSGIKTKQLAGVALNSKVSGLAISGNKEEESPTRMITGVIKGQSGEPLPGASVSIIGSSISTITDTNGNFRLILAPGQKMLEVSYLGYNTQNVTLADKSSVEISLKESLMALSEVVVTAYGEKRKAKSAAGNVSKSDSPSRKDKEVMADKSENRSLQVNTIDSLKLLLNKDSGNKILIKQLAEKYVESGNQKESLEQLRKLQSLTTDPLKLQDLDEIIQLTESGKFKAALRKLKKE